MVNFLDTMISRKQQFKNRSVYYYLHTTFDIGALVVPALFAALFRFLGRENLKNGADILLLNDIYLAT